MGEVGCLKDGHFQNLVVENTTIFDTQNMTLGNGSGTITIDGNLSVGGSVSGTVSGNGIRMTAVGTATYSGTFGGTAYKGLIITATWPANAYLLTVDVYVTVGAISSATGTDDTIINIADGTNAIIGSATSVNNDGTTAPGSAGIVIFADDTARTVGKTASVTIAAVTDAVRLSSSNRTFTATIYHDANGANDGAGDGADAITHNDAKVYIVYTGFFAG